MILAFVLATVAGLAGGGSGVRAAGSDGVATLVHLAGRVDFRSAQGPWYAAYPELRQRLLDHLRTGSGSVATLDFDVGGRVGINDDSEIQIVGERGVEEVGQGGFRRLVLQAGGIWARVTRQTDELQVQTSGGVMGVKGTEFVVETTRDGPTTLSVLEGAVEVRPAQGDPLLAQAGTRVTFDPAKVPVVKTYEDPEELRREVMEGWDLFNQAAGPLMAATGTGAVRYYGDMALDVVRDPAQAARDFAASQVSSRVPFGGMLGGVLSSGGRKQAKKPDFPTGLGPDQAEIGTELPRFNWEPMEKAVGFVVLLSRDEGMQALDWTARVAGTSASYPENGRPLPPGRYFWRLVGVDEHGQPVGRASQTWFDSDGWRTLQPEDAETPEESEETGAPADPGGSEVSGEPEEAEF